MARYVFDLEANGFLDQATCVHSLVMINIDTGVMHSCQNMPDQLGIKLTIAQGLDILAQADLLVGHNICKFDLPLIRKLYPWFETKAKLFDTMIASRLIYGNIERWDNTLFKKGTLPGKYFGNYSLAAWGFRLGLHKGEFEGPWDAWSEAMQSYCELDVRVTLKLYERLITKPVAQTALDIEQELAPIIAQIEQNGFYFDKEKAVALYAELAAKREKLWAELRGLFQPWFRPKGKDKSTGLAKTFTPKKDNAKLGYTAGATFSPVEYHEFNPKSRHDAINRLRVICGWKPAAFTQSGEAQIDEEILAALPYPEAKALSELYMLQKRIGQIAEGNEAWFNYYRDGKVFHTINQMGTRTHRATHSKFNIAQVPSIKNAKGVVPYGRECRECFTVPQGWKLVGTDQSGIELRGLAHYLGKWDGGAYVNVILSGDIHTANQVSAGLDSRDKAKRFIYAYLYGAGDPMLGSIAEPTANAARHKRVGKEKRKLFEGKTVGMADLVKLLGEKFQERGYIIGLDGRHLYDTSERTLLNTLLQGFGGLMSKVWIILLVRKLTALGLNHGWDGQYAICAWVHDELQIAVRDEHVETVKQASIEAALDAGKLFNLRIPIAAEAKTGSNWAETH
jgi:DNA polymerase-1